MEPSQAGSSMVGEISVLSEVRHVYEPERSLGDIEGHLCQRLLQEQELPRFPGSRCFNKPAWLAPLLERVESNARSFLHRWGFIHLLIFARYYSGMLIHWDALGALVELWHPQTHTFLFPTFEGTILLEETEVFLGLRRPVEDKVIAHYMESLDAMEFLSQLTKDRLQARNIRTSGGIRLSRLTSWAVGARNEGKDDEKIAQALSLCLAGLFLFPRREDILDQEHLGVIRSAWRGRSLAQPVLAYLYRGLSSACTEKPFHGCVILLDIWLSLHIKMIHSTDSSDKRLRTYRQSPIYLIRDILHFTDMMVIKTLKLQNREDWRRFLARIAPMFFTFYNVVLGKMRLRASPWQGVDLRLVGSTELVLYNAHRCYLQLGLPRHVIPRLSHYPPVELRVLGTDRDHVDVRTSMELWKVNSARKVETTFAQENFDLLDPYRLWLRELRSVGF